MKTIRLRNRPLRKQTASEEGFTLVELMIVVVIIGILAAIAIPIFANQQKAADYAAVKSDVKNIATMALAHKTKNGKYPVTCEEWASVLPAVWKSDPTTFVKARTSPDGLNIWLEGQPVSSAGLAGADKADVTAVYNSNRTSGILSRNEYSAKYGVELSYQQEQEGYTVRGYDVYRIGECITW